MDRQADRQTEKQQYHANSRSYCAAVRSANKQRFIYHNDRTHGTDKMKKIIKAQ